MNVTVHLDRDTRLRLTGPAALIEEGRLAYTPSGFVEYLHGARLQLPALADVRVVERGEAGMAHDGWAAQLAAAHRQNAALRTELGLPAAEASGRENQEEDREEDHAVEAEKEEE